MNSGEINEISNWSDWRQCDATSIPSSPGIYAFRIGGGVAVPRVRGQSDILYIGSSMVNLRMRLRKHHQMRTAESLLLNLIETHLGQSEVGWASLDQASAFATESDLIFKYSQEHLEFPPANNQQPARAVREKILNLVSLLPPHVKVQVIHHFADKRLEH